MPRKRQRPEGIAAKLRQVDVLVSQGVPVADVMRQICLPPILWFGIICLLPMQSTLNSPDSRKCRSGQRTRFELGVNAIQKNSASWGWKRGLISFLPSPSGLNEFVGKRGISTVSVPYQCANGIQASACVNEWKQLATNYPKCQRTFKDMAHYANQIRCLV